jgi:ATP-dependent helicase/nuclease subunit B
MKTIIADQYQKNKILHHLASENHGVLTDIQVISLRTAMQEDREDHLETLLLLKNKLNEKKENFPTYKDMLVYPSFIEEILTFTQKCLLWGIQEKDLPERNNNDKQLKQILSAAFSLPLPEKKIHQERDQRLFELKKQDLVLYPSFYKDEYHYELYQELLKTFPYPVKTVTPKKHLQYALNARQEIESVAQDICRNNLSCNVILTSYQEQYPVVKQIFTRYGIPFASMQDMTFLHVPHIYAALCNLAYHKDKTSFLDALRSNAFPCYSPDFLIDYLDQVMTDVRPPLPIAEKLKNSPFKKDAAIYAYLEKKSDELFTAIQDDYDLLLSSSTPEEIFSNAYAVLRNASCLQPGHVLKEDLNAAFGIKRSLEASLKKIKAEDVPFLIETFAEQSDVSLRSESDFCTVSDLTHPVPCQNVTYILGCNGVNYPGFTGASGLFDEDYVQQIKKYPSLSVRHNSYMDQLQWITQSASDTIYYSYASNNYEGKAIELALDVETIFPELMDEDHKIRPVKWPLEILAPITLSHCTLKPDTAKALFQNPKDQLVYGSISTIEKYFDCPFAYYVKSGLHVQKQDPAANDNAAIGTIAHAVVEESVNRHGDKYYEITEDEIREILAPYFDALKISHPNELASLEVTKERMVTSLLMSMTILKDMQIHTTYKPLYVEKKFESKFVPGLLLNGVIDRVDVSAGGVRVLDYKSSGKKLTLKEVVAGQKLQLLTYLIIAEGMTKKMPAGTFYFSLAEANVPAIASKMEKDPVTKSYDVTDVPTDDASNLSLALKKRRLAGWRFVQTEELDDNKEHISCQSTYLYPAVQKCMKEIYTYFIEQVCNGNIIPAPIKDACTYCDYGNICRFHGDFRIPETIYKGELKAPAKAKGKK